MTSDLSIFVELNDNYRSRVKVGNGDHVEVKGIGVVSVQTPTGTKLISNVLYVPNIDQNLISAGQLIEKKFTLIFEGNGCTILDPSNNEPMSVELKQRSFPLEWKKVISHAHKLSI